MAIVRAVLLLALLGLTAAKPLGLLGDLFSALTDIRTAPGIHTVPELDVEQYLGRWYQMFTDFVVTSTFERNAVCVTADYGLNGPGNISVYNANREKTPDGDLNDIQGYATVPDPSQPGKLEVKFDSVPGVLGQYWVIRLGPVVQGKYDYSVVTDSFKMTLFVLARDPDKFRTEYQDDVLAFLADQGFTRFYNRPVETLQSDDCQYAPKPPN
ncbi:uncharacterized protein [Diadema antillarum]|uniref:uncharacterized protein n=1 Tax=Diadema antillarum TaxID=105358 RepID=UPI003A893234